MEDVSSSHVCGRSACIRRDVYFSACSHPEVLTVLAAQDQDLAALRAGPWRLFGLAEVRCPEPSSASTLQKSRFLV